MKKQKKLNKAFKKRWVAALRSGKYEQGFGQLRVDDAYCCLGVAEDIVGCKWKVCGGRMDDVFGQIYQTQEGHVYLPSEHGKLVKEAGLPLKDVQVKINNKRRTLDAHNDRGATFEQIADAVEKQL